MKNILARFLFLASLFVACTLHAQVVPSIEWEKSLGGSKDEKPNSIQQCSDGGYIVAGWSRSNDGNVSGNHVDYYGNTSYDFWIVRLDSLGNLVWEKSLGGSSNGEAYSVQQTTDGDFIVAGYTYSNDGDVFGIHGDYSSDYWIVKLNSAGNIIWQKCLGGSADDNAISIQQTTDGGFVVAGTSGSTDGDATSSFGFGDYWIVKLDSIGNLVWQKSFGGSVQDIASSIDQTSDGGFIVAGSSLSNDHDVSGNHGNYDYWIVKLDTVGNLVWQKSLGGSNFDYANSIQQTADHGFIVAGYSYSNDDDVSGNHGSIYGAPIDYWIVKLDSVGNIIWQKCLGGSDGDEASSVQQTTDHGFIIGGWCFSNDGDVSGNHCNYISPTFDYWILKLDSVGNLVWQKCLGGYDRDYGCSTEQTTDGGFIVAGYSKSIDGDVSGNHGVYDFWIVKLSPDIPTAISSSSIYFISLFPNPTQSQLTINLTTPANQVTIRVYDLQGREMNCGFRIANVELNSIQLNTSTLPDGFYTLQIINNKTSESEVGKFVKQ